MSDKLWSKSIVYDEKKKFFMWNSKRSPFWIIRMIKTFVKRCTACNWIAEDVLTVVGLVTFIASFCVKFYYSKHNKKVRDVCSNDWKCCKMEHDKWLKLDMCEGKYLRDMSTLEKLILYIFSVLFFMNNPTQLKYHVKKKTEFLVCKAAYIILNESDMTASLNVTNAYCARLTFAKIGMGNAIRNVKWSETQTAQRI